MSTSVEDLVLRDSLAETATHLISFKTTASRFEKEATAGGPTTFDACLQWVQDHIRTCALDPQQITMRRFLAGGNAGKPSLLIWRGNRLPSVLMAGHLDVVESSDVSAWKALRRTGPCVSRPETTEQLVGRGAADMKGPVAACLDIIETVRLPGLGLLLTCDEENGGHLGTRFVLETLQTEDHWLPEVIVLPDGGAGMRLIVEQKGLLRIHFAAQGKPTHAARPWQGVNALLIPIGGLELLKRVLPQPTADEDPHLSITLTKLRSGGNALNAVPDLAEGTLDIRYAASGPSRNEIFSEIQAFMVSSARSNGGSIFLKEDKEVVALPFCLDPGNLWVDRLQRVAERSIHRRLPFSKEAGSSDARFFAAAGIPGVLIFQPEGAGWHGDDEWVSLESLVTFHTLCTAFVQDALTGA